MAVAEFQLLARQRYVERLGLELGLQRALRHDPEQARQPFLDLGADFIGLLAEGRAFLGRKRAHLLEYSGDLAFFAEQFHAKRLQLGDVACGVQLFKGVAPDALQ